MALYCSPKTMSQIRFKTTMVTFWYCLIFKLKQIWSTNLLTVITRLPIVCVYHNCRIQLSNLHLSQHKQKMHSKQLLYTVLYGKMRQPQMSIYQIKCQQLFAGIWNYLDKLHLCFKVLKHFLVPLSLLVMTFYINRVCRL